MKHHRSRRGIFTAPTIFVHEMHNSPKLDAVLVQAINHALSYGSSTITHHLPSEPSTLPTEDVLFSFTQYYTKSIAMLHVPGRRLLGIDITTEDAKTIFVKLE
ncbi:MAG: hypothetical protein CL685_02820 [Candidatus Magasanikbacteria bacterium]|nr:hypothetical protein [Candidatus Magasanikbacteria bacterium]|tara:strand:- start:499 stop:807 length:309 start_codon:yes stop_codon:yes gene_type:complete